MKNINDVKSASHQKRVTPRNYFHLVAFILFVVTNLAFAQNPVKPGVYPWPTASSEKNSAQVVLSGTATDLNFFEVTANVLARGKQQKTNVPATHEHLLLINSESITVMLNDSTYTLVKGSVALVMPGEKYSIKNNGSNPVNYHVMKYRSRLPIDLGRGKTSGGSFVKDWNKLTFKPHERGGVRPYFDRPTAMAKRFEMHTTTLNEGNISHPPHTHAAEEIILVLEGEVEMLIGETWHKAKQGDVLFAPSKMPHGLKNIGKGQCSYFAFQWE